MLGLTRGIWEASNLGGRRFPRKRVFREKTLRRCYCNAANLSRFRLPSNYNIHIAVQSREKIHQPFDRKSIQLIIGQGGNLWLIYIQATRCCGLRELPTVNDLIDCNCESHLRLFLFCVW